MGGEDEDSNGFLGLDGATLIGWPLAQGFYDQNRGKWVR